MLGVVDWLNTNEGFVLSLLTLAYVVATFMLVFITLRALGEDRRRQRQAIAPLVVADLEFDGERHTAHFVLRNAGLTTALDVALTVSPPLVNPVHPQLNLDASNALIRKGVPAMAPGKELRLLVGTFGNWGKDLSDKRHTVAVTWTDRRQPETRQSAEYAIDFEVLGSLPPAPPKTIHSLVGEVEKLRGALEELRTRQAP
jgi:hypothetical protein